MAVKRVDFFSDCLRRRVEYHVAMPKAYLPKEEGGEGRQGGLKTLVLLHGYCEMGMDYLEKTNIEELAEQYNLCVILPNGENSFYLDGKATGRQYGTYVGQEILRHARGYFSLSDKKEDTFIGGSSMGGFGAIHTGLLFHENFGGLFGMSSALIMDLVASGGAGAAHGIANQEYYDLMFGPGNELPDSPNDPRVLVREMVAKGISMPIIYLACGTSDFMIEESRAFARFLTEQGVAHTYVEGDGGHDFTFWNAHLEPAIRTMLKI